MKRTLLCAALLTALSTAVPFLCLLFPSVPVQAAPTVTPSAAPTAAAQPESTAAPSAAPTFPQTITLHDEASDSDFTRLAIRLREAGMKVYGMGEKKTPKPFIVACDKFVYIEVIRAAAQQAAQQEKESVPQKSSKKSSKKAAQQAVSAPAASAVPQDMVELIADSLENLCDEDGYTLMGKLSNLLMKKQPDFDPRNYGFSKLSKMIKSLDRFEVDVRQVGDNNTDIYVRDKQGKDK